MTTTTPALPAVSPVAVPDTRRDARTAFAVFVVAFALFAACIPRITTFLDPVTGDEPFYLMTACTILHEGTIDETKTFAAHDWLRFYPAFPLPKNFPGWPISPDLKPHASHTYRTGLYSKHGLGIPLLILAPFAVGGRVGVVLLYNLMAAGVAANIYLLARTVAARSRALVVTAILMGSVPLVTYAFLIFPEIPAALMLTYALRRLLAPANTRWQWLLTGACIGYLPWLHARFALVVIGLVGLFFWRHGRATLSRALPGALPGARSGVWWGIVPAALSGLVFEAYSLVFYHFPLPNTRDHAGFDNPLNGFVGSLLDAQWGLFVVSPVYVLAAAALVLFTIEHERRRDGLALLLILALYGVTICSYAVWWGEWGPAARYWTAALPMLALPLAWWLERAMRHSPVGTIIMLGLVVAWGLVFTMGWLRQPQWLYNQPTGVNNLLVHGLGGFGQRLAAGLPAYQFYAPSPLITRVLWAVAVGLISVAAGSEMTLLMLPNAGKEVREAHGVD